MRVDTNEANRRLLAVEERDIDFLLLQEFWCSPPFREWFLRRLGLDARAHTFTHAERSVHGPDGESDVVVEFGAALALLIENKLGAAFQPEQGTRYRTRADAAVASGRFSNCHTILVAPADYIAAHESGPHVAAFDAVVTLEDLGDWFVTHTNEVQARFKTAVIRNALDGRVGGRAHDPAMTDFQTLYWRTHLRVAPELNLKRPDVRGPSSDFMVLRPAELEKYRRGNISVELQHKLSRGVVDLELRRCWEARDDFQQRFGVLLPDWIQPVRAGKSLALRVIVPALYVGQEYGAQEGKAEDALRSASVLACWAAENTAILEWADSRYAATLA
jgi:hypothetical protein